jgi:FkbM family methyltransferase
VRANTRFGPLYFRPGDSDLMTLWQTLGACEYDLGRFPQAATITRVYEEALACGRTPVIVDAGANIGGASLWFSRRYPRARIFAVEPDPANAALCRRNTEGHQVEVIEAAIGSRPGSVSLVSGDAAWGIQTARGGDIPIVTVGEILGRAPDPVLLIAKIDIEGFESDLFAGETGWIDAVTALYIEPHDWMLPGAGSSRAFRAAIGPEFEMLISGENLVFVRAS